MVERSAAQAWLLDECLPFWMRKGVDGDDGAFTEHLALDGGKVAAGFRRTRVLARQTYVFAHAGLLGVEGAEALSERGARYLIEHAWLGDERGWARRLGERGDVLDDTPDLYDLAFVLFALGWRFRATRDADLLDLAKRTLGFIRRRMKHPSGRGFVPSLDAPGVSEQNPHMHLLEASLVWLQAGVDEEFRPLADSLVELFLECFFDGEALREYFDDQWRPAPGEAGRLVEPGHQFEWAWILQQYQAVSSVDVADAAKRLTDFAERTGVSTEGLTWRSVRDDGVALDRGSRVWPNTERIKAAVAMCRLFGQDPEPWFQQSTDVLLKRFFRPAPSGAWIDAIDEAGAPAVDKIPASSLYHVFLAFAEMQQVRRAARPG